MDFRVHFALDTTRSLWSLEGGVTRKGRAPALRGLSFSTTADSQ